MVKNIKTISVAYKCEECETIWGSIKSAELCEVKHKKEKKENCNHAFVKFLVAPGGWIKAWCSECSSAGLLRGRVNMSRGHTIDIDWGSACCETKKD